MTTVECSLCHPSLCTGIDFIGIGVRGIRMHEVVHVDCIVPFAFAKSLEDVRIICLPIRHETNLGHTNLLDTVLTKSKTISVSISPAFRS